MHDHRRDGIHPGAPIDFRDRDSEQSQLADPTKQRKVEALEAIEFDRLRFHLLLGEVLHGLTNRTVLCARIEQIEVGA